LFLREGLSLFPRPALDHDPPNSTSCIAGIRDMQHYG
jgi:hypothetical protein